MFFQKIGKKEQKFNLTIKLHKASYSDTAKSKGQRHLKILVTSHKLEFTTMPFKKGEIKCNKQSYSIPMTLYYDQDTHKFLKKQIEVSGEILNDLDEQEIQFERSVINISQYMSNTGSDKFALEVQLNDQEKRSCVLKFHVFIERIEQQSHEQNKSTNTNDRYQSSNEVSEDGDSKFGKKTQTAKYQFKQITPSDTSSQKSVNIHSKLPPKSIKKSQFQKIATEPFSLDVPRSVNQESAYEDQSQSSTQPRRKPSFSNAPSRTPPKPYKNSRDKNIGQKPAEQKQGYLSQETPSLAFYTLQKKLKESEKKFQLAKKQIEDQKNLINKLLEQQNKAYNSGQMIKRTNQIQTLKSQLLKANLRIGQLQTRIRHLQASQKQNQQILDTKAKKAAYYEQQLTKTKLVFGRLMQRCYQMNDTDLMAFIEEQLGNI